MVEEINAYLNQHKERIKKKIIKSLTNENLNLIIEAIKNNFDNKKPQSFQIFYYQTISNKEYFLSEKNFFGKFKQQYSLQGVDKKHLKILEENKEEIFSLIKNNDLSSLYFRFFYNVSIQHGNNKITRNLGSFFAKLVHTFAPDKYCALDTPIKKYFGLEKESYYIALVIISCAYTEWANENQILLKEIKSRISSITTTDLTKDMTNLKILDLIFWHQANIITQ
ncbi:MAG TPA: hypothetical protein DIW23_04890 [Anaerolineae bacterium]|nr:hypothetical protein [Anaerolineae bacterium]